MDEISVLDPDRPRPAPMHQHIRCFVETFYTVLSDPLTSSSIIPSNYEPCSTILFDGQRFRTPEAFAAFFASRPKSTFKVHNFEASTINDSRNGHRYLLTCGGVVKYHEKSEFQGFSDSLVLIFKPAPPGYETFRVESQVFQTVKV